MPDPARITAWLACTDVPERPEVEVEVEVVPTPAATLWARNPQARYDGGGFRLAIDPARLEPGQWRLHLRLSHAGIDRSGSLHRYVAGASASHTLARMVGDTHDPLLVTPARNPMHGFSLKVSHPEVRLVALDPTGPRSATGRVRTAPGIRLSSVRAVAERASARAVLTEEGPDEWGISVSLPAMPSAETDDWKLVAQVDDPADPERDPARIAWALPGPVVGPGADPLEWAPGWSGTARAGACRRLVEVSSVELGDVLVVRIQRHRVPLARLETMTWGNSRVVLGPLHVVETGPDQCEITFPLETSVLGGPVLPLPQGNYRLELTEPTGLPTEATTPVMASRELVESLPGEFATERLTLRVTSSPAARDATFSVGPPLRPDERTLAGLTRLRRDYRAASPAPRDAVLFQCYRGEFATDSQRPLDEALRTARPDLTRYWGVADLSVEVPEGSTPLLIDSREWYEVLGSARYLCNNIDFDGFFRKRSFQRFLETFHGYPFKSMGRTFWKGKGYTEDRIARELERRNEEYDAIIVPSERAAGFYRDEYDYTGRILVTGYPRSDFPVTADRARTRAVLGARLGISPEVTVVLYAPTYRDNLTTRTYAAKLFDELDLERLTRHLGPDVVVLLRGHNNNQREQARVRDLGRVVDVTDYPEVNHLTAAADAAILDYSSLRFDWALTGKPMVFFVPDVDDYFAARPPLFGFRESAPGPLLATTDEVADALADIPGLADRHRQDIAAFNAEFNQLHDGRATQRVVEQFFTDA